MSEIKKRTTKQRYSLNLSPRYAPNWSAWEVAREVICNAIDAAPNDLVIESVSDDKIRVWTPTVPDMGELLIVGQGSKRPGGTTIGQFGEGLKMAALVATRDREGHLEFHLPGKTVSFEFRDVLGAQVLHAVLADAPHRDGYEAVITMPGIGRSYEKKLLPDRKAGPTEKQDPKKMQVYAKGVHVTTEDVNCLWDWNLNDMSVNRDRSMVARWDLVSSIATWLGTYATNSQLRQIVRYPYTIEGSNAIQYISRADTLDRIAAEFYDEHGEKSVMATEDPAINLKASAAGFKVISVPPEFASKMRSRIKLASDVLERNHDLEPVDHMPYMPQLERLRSLDAMLAAPNFSITVYANREEHAMGRADIEDMRMWLNESLFSEGNELSLIRTYLHEMGHLCSGAGDRTYEFECALDGIAGRLAIRLFALECPESILREKVAA